MPELWLVPAKAACEQAKSDIVLKSAAYGNPAFVQTGSVAMAAPLLQLLHTDGIFM